MNHKINLTLTFAVSDNLGYLLGRLIDRLGGMTAAEADAVTAKLREQSARLEGIAGDVPAKDVKL